MLFDPSGASVAGKETLDLCATSGASMRGFCCVVKKGSGHWGPPGGGGGGGGKGLVVVGGLEIDKVGEGARLTSD